MTKQEIEFWEKLTGGAISNPDEFFVGQTHCKDGLKEREGMGEVYRRGYAAQYQLEQLKEKGFIK